jgi:hypothetical protein
MIKVSVIVLVGLLAATLLRRQSAALRHWVLASAIACAAAMPVLQLIVPAWQVPMRVFSTSHQGVATMAAGGVPAAWLLEDTATGNRPVAAGAQGATLPSLQSIWLAGVAASLSLLLLGFGRMAWVTSRSRKVVDGTWCDMATVLADRRRPGGLTKCFSRASRRTSNGSLRDTWFARRFASRRPVQLLQSAHPTLLVTWGLTHPKVVLPRDAREWPAGRIRAVLAHELAHVERCDWAVQMVAELLRCIYWFNPLLWVACRRLRQESEQACDDAVLSMGVDAPEYATHLLDVARAFRHTRARRSLFPAPAMARRSHLEGRVRAMLNAGLSRAPLTRVAGIAIVVSLFAVTVPIAGLVASSDLPRPAQPQPRVAVTVSVPRDQVLPVDRRAKVRPVAPPVARPVAPGASAPGRSAGGDASPAPVSTASRTTA